MIYPRIVCRELNEEETKIALERQRQRQQAYDRVRRVADNTADVYEFLDWAESASIESLEIYARNRS